MASSIDAPSDLRAMRESAGAAAFTFLSDADGQLLDLLGVRHTGGGYDGGDIAQSATFLISPDGTVLWSHVADNYRLRPVPAEVLAAVDAALP